MTWNGASLPDFTIHTVHTEDPLAVQVRVLTRALNAANDELERSLADKETLRHRLASACAVADLVIATRDAQTVHRTEIVGHLAAKAWRDAVTASNGIDAAVRCYQGIGGAL